MRGKIVYAYLSEAGVTSGMKRAVAGAKRKQREGASGKWVAHWKMVHIGRSGKGPDRATNWDGNSLR